MPQIRKNDEPFQTRQAPSPRGSTSQNAAALVSLLEEWMDGDEAEQRETFEVLLLVQREMESWRAPLASIAPIPPGQFAPPKAVVAGGRGSD